jgi:CRISPR-associated endonuclease/helicase Cas3
LWAKSAQRGWRPKRDGREVKGFRHELAPALAWMLMAQLEAHKEGDLVGYLIAAHHGRVRLSIRSLPDEMGDPTDPDRLFARGVWDGDKLPSIVLNGINVPAMTLDLSFMKMGHGVHGPSWLARAVALRERLGPFRLAYLETLLRAADMRISAAAGQSQT